MNNKTNTLIGPFRKEWAFLWKVLVVGLFPGMKDSFFFREKDQQQKPVRDVISSAFSAALREAVLVRIYRNGF